MCPCDDGIANCAMYRKYSVHKNVRQKQKYFIWLSHLWSRPNCPYFSSPSDATEYVVLRLQWIFFFCRFFVFSLIVGYWKNNSRDRHGICSHTAHHTPAHQWYLLWSRMKYIVFLIFIPASELLKVKWARAPFYYYFHSFISNSMVTHVTASPSLMLLSFIVNFDFKSEKNRICILYRRI